MKMEYEAKAVVNGVEQIVPAHLELDGECTRLIFDQPVTLQYGDTLTVPTGEVLEELVKEMRRQDELTDEEAAFLDAHNEGVD